jgi:glycyl-tRNA synthetase
VFLTNEASKLRAKGISYKVDDSSRTIGRRYARNDELGTPFGITIDFETCEDGSVTLRERDSTAQIRAPQDEIIQVMRDIVDGRKTWHEAIAQYGELSND